MIYNNLLYFLVVIFAVSIDTPPESPHLHPAAAGPLLVFLYILFSVTCARLYRRTGVSSARYFGAEKRLSILAVLLFVFLLHTIDLKYYAHPLSLDGRLPILENLGCLAFFYLFLVLMWLRARPSYQIIFQRHYSPLSFVSSNTRANLPIILPWLAISLVFDLLALLELPILQQTLESPYGDLAIFLVFIFFLVLLFPPLVRWLWKCTPMPSSPLRDEITRFCHSQNFSSEILIWPLFEGQVITAGIMGILPKFRYLLITPALLKTMNSEELEAVLAHEIGHVKKKHLLLYIFLFLGFSLFAGAASGPLPVLYLGSNWFYTLSSTLRISPESLLAGLIAMPLLVFMLLYFRFLFGYFIRNFERQADLFVFKALGYGSGLISSFEKIAVLSGNIREQKSWHHFGIGERIDFLQRCEYDRSLIRKHDRKLYSSLLVYIVVIALAVLMLGRIDNEKLAAGYETKFMEAVIAHKLHQEPDNGLLFLFLGDLLQQKQMERKAIAAYERALALRPDHADIHNNLAWLLLTARDSSLHDPSRALRLAQKAVSIKEEGYILDTLAVALWANGQNEKAIQTEKRAIQVDPKNRNYYTSQAEKMVRQNWHSTQT